MRRPASHLRVLVSPDEFRSVMGHLATGVTIVTAAGPNGPVGMTANAVCSLSLEPLLVLVCFDNDARTLPVIRAGGRFGVNVLTQDQEALAVTFASKAREAAKFAGVPYAVHDGIPVIDDVLAWVGCEATEWIAGGDHTIALGAVTAAEAGEGAPLLWYRGAYGRLA